MKKLNLFVLFVALSLLALGCGGEGPTGPTNDPPVRIDKGILHVPHPPGSEVMVADSLVGIAPYEDTWYAGEYPLRIVLLDKKLFNKTVTVYDNLVTTVSPTVTIMGTIYVEDSNPQQPVPEVLVELLQPDGTAVVDATANAQGYFEVDWAEWMQATRIRYGKDGWNPREMEILIALQVKDLPISAKPAVPPPPPPPNLFEGFVNGREWLFQADNGAAFKVIINIQGNKITFKDPEKVAWDQHGTIIDSQHGEVRVEIGSFESDGIYEPGPPEKWTGIDDDGYSWSLTLAN